LNIVDLKPGEQALTFQPTEILHTRMVVRALICAGCTEKEAKTNAGNFFHGMEELMCEARGESQTKPQRLLSGVEKRRRETVHQRALQKVSQILD
jgi:hypothetical protein